MKGLDTKEYTNIDNAKNWLKNLGYTILLAITLSIASPTEAQENKPMNNQNNIELIYKGNIMNYIESETETTIPSIYKEKVQDFFSNNNVMKNNNSKNFTIEFILKEMESNWGNIDKDKQIMIILYCVYKELTGENLFENNILNDKNIQTRIKIVTQKFRKRYTTKMNNSIEEANKRYEEANKRYEEANKRYEEADKRYEEANRDIMQKDTLGLKEMAKFYSMYIKNPNNIKKEEIEKSKELLKWVISDCKNNGIDYKAILLQIVGDQETVEAIVKFYEEKY